VVDNESLQLTANQADGEVFRRTLHSLRLQLSAVCVFSLFSIPFVLYDRPRQIPRMFARHHIAAHSQASPFSSFQIIWDSYRLYNTPTKPV